MTTAQAGLDPDVTAGDSVAVTGPPGSAKTTLLHSLAGIVMPDDGTVRFTGPAGEVLVGVAARCARIVRLADGQIISDRAADVRAAPPGLRQ